MLGKLFKYEFKATARILGVIYLAVLVCAALFGIVGRASVSHFGMVYEVMDNAEAVSSAAGTSRSMEVAIVVFGIIYMLLIVSMFVVTAILIISRFYRNLLRGEGYLMHTLPVPTWQLVLSKTLSALLWMVLSFLVMLLSFFILILTAGLMRDVTFGIFIQDFRDFLLTFNLSGVFLVVLVIIEMVEFVLTIYFCLAIGNIANQHKIMFAILTFIGVMIVETIISGVAQSTLLGSMFQWDALYGTPDMANAEIARLMRGAEIRQLIMNLVYGVLFFFGTTFTLKNRLNLE
ncbi:MAG: hypothetical protein IJ860_01505 [Eubacterium sp.]|nr:hypothetical protein [Eubacterium sp.]